MTELLHQWLQLPIDASTHGHEIDQLIYFVHILMVVLFIGWGAFFTYLLVRFRKSKQQKADYAGVRSHASSYLEGVIVVIEILLLAAFSIPFWAKKVSAAQEPPAEALRIRVVAQTFVWNIHYPGKDGKFGTTRLDENYNEKTNALGLDRKSPGGADDITSINQLRIPVGKPVVLEITSRDVIHSVAIPLLRVKQDAIPGMSIPMEFTASKTSADIAKHCRRTLKIPTKLNSTLYMPTEDVKDKDGNVLLRARLRIRQDTRVDLPTKRDLTLDRASLDYKDKDGNILVAKNSKFPADIQETLRQNGFRNVSVYTQEGLLSRGITEVSVIPAEPVEIICGQLCGNGHYNMKGFVQILTPAEYERWLDREDKAARGIEDDEDDDE